LDGLWARDLATPEKSILKTLAADAREKEEKERITRQRVLLRVVTELWLVGV
jgi:regulator of nonsense transcripts 2